jgi:hypothetical protein
MATLRESVEAVIKRQLTTAQEYEAKGAYYPPQVVKAIRSAAVCGQDAALGALARSLDARGVADAVATASARWRESQEDEDGYGSATLHEIVAALRGLAST